MEQQDDFSPAAFPVHEGLLVDNYQILEKLGVGGMGIVYKAQDIRLKRMVAIKFMQKPDEGAHGKLRFSREIEISARFTHAHIVRVYGMGTFDKFPYFVMEYIEGMPLHKYVTLNDITLQDKLIILQKVAHALHYAHEQKIVHRDIKSSNIMVRNNGEPVLMDFGLAKTTQVKDYKLTRTGEVVGTPEYMAPEQACGMKRAIDAQSDVYGLGAVMYHMLVGRPPVSGDNLLEKIYQIVEKRPRRPRTFCPELPTAVEKICLKALEKKKEHRYASAAALAADIEAFLSGEATLSAKFYSRRLLYQSLCGSVVVLLALALVSGIWWYVTHRLQTTGRVPVVSGYWLEVERHYAAGMSKLSSTPHEAYIYLQRATELMAQIKLPTLDKVALARFHEIGKSLPPARLEAAAGAGKYQEAYALGKKILATQSVPDEAIGWHVACAAYHCGFLEEAAECFAQIAGKLAQEADVPAKTRRMAQALYYQGAIAFRQNLLIAAKDFFARALPGLADQEDDLTVSLYLHRCAANMPDLEQTASEQELQQLGSAMAIVDKNCQGNYDNPFFANMFYWETKARYLLQVAERRHGQEKNDKAQEALAFIEKCFATGQVKAGWHYIRGKARILLGDYAHADDDLAMVGDLDPVLGGAAVSQSASILLNPCPSEMQNYSMLLPGHIFRSFRQSVVIPQFTELQCHYASHTSSMSGLTFSQNLFAEYYNKLSDPSPEVRQVAKTALAAMLPYNRTRAALNEAMGRLKSSERTFVAEVVEAIDAQEQQHTRRKFMNALCGVPFSGKIFEIRRFYPHYVKLLQETLQQEKNVFLRFLAAKVLVQLPVLETRKYLWQNYVSTQPDTQHKDALVNRILVAYAFQEIGYLPDLDEKLANTVWEMCRQKQGPLFCEQPNEEIFAETLLAQILRVRSPATTQILGWLLQHGSDAVRISAASRFARPYVLKERFPAIYNRLLRCLQEGLASPYPEIKTATLAALADYLDSPDLITYADWGQIIMEQFISPQMVREFCETIGNASLNLGRAMLYFWRHAVRLSKISEHEATLAEMRKALRSLWQNASPRIRYHAIMTSAELCDKEVYAQIAFNENATHLERLSALFGGVGFNRKNIPLWLISQLDKYDLFNDTNCRVSITLLYAIGRTGKGILSSKVFAGLSHPNPLIRFAAAVSCGYLNKLPAKRIEQLQKMVETDSVHYVRFTALGVLLHHACREKSPFLEKLHRYAKEYRQDHWQECRNSAAWGYSLLWEEQALAVFRHGRQFGELKQQNWDYSYSEFVRNSRDAGARSAYIDRLRRCMELLADMPESAYYHDYAYLLASLYEKEQRFDEAIQVLSPIIARQGHQETRCAFLWSRLMLQQGRGSEARLRLEQMLSALAGQQHDDWLGWQNHAARESQLRRGLGKILLNDARSQPQAEILMQEQFLLAPHLLSALETMGEYYYQKKDYGKATQIFEALQDRLQRYGESYVWLARIAMQERDREKAFFYLQQAQTLNYLVSREELRAYPEFSSILEHETVKNIFAK
jgi:hypothetical protein